MHRSDKYQEREDDESGNSIEEEEVDAVLPGDSSVSETNSRDGLEPWDTDEKECNAPKKKGKRVQDAHSGNMTAQE